MSTVLAPGENIMVMTSVAHRILACELRHEDHMRAHPCRYCQARKNDPCHTRDGRIRFGYHVTRHQDCRCDCRCLRIGDQVVWGPLELGDSVEHQYTCADMASRNWPNV